MILKIESCFPLLYNFKELVHFSVISIIEFRLVYFYESKVGKKWRTVMNFKSRVEATRKYLTISEKKVTDYILSNPQKAVQMGINNLAEASKTSAATVSRLVKSLQIDSYTTMKVMLSRDLAAQEESDTKDTQLDINANESFESISNKLIKNEIENLSQTQNLLNKKVCEEVVTKLIETNHIYVFGLGASSLAAKDIYQKWTRIGCNVTCEEDFHVLLTQIASATAKSTLWLISNSGETPECLYLANYAKQHHLFVITLTMFGQNSLLKIADLALTTCKPIEPDVRVGATNSIAGQFYVINVIFYLYFSHDFQNSAKAVEESRDLIKLYQQKWLK